ncbi:Hypothetical protein BRZCDTV_308, partial [Brazilian cedratvirus IHUMI]
LPPSSFVTSSEKEVLTLGEERESKGNLDYLVTLGAERAKENDWYPLLVWFVRERLVPSCTLF